MDALREVDIAIDNCGELLDECKGSPKPKSYKLLRRYYDTARTSSIAHKVAESYYRHMNRILLIALMVLTTTGSVLVSIPSIDNDHLVSKIIAYLVTIIGGILTIIKPAERFTQHNSIATEYNDIATDIEQLLMSNGLTRAEIADANHLYLSKLQIFDSQAPPLNASFVSQARKQMSMTARIDSSIKKKSRRYVRRDGHET